MGLFWTHFSWAQVGLAFLAGIVICQLNIYLTTAVLHRGLCHGSVIYPAWLKRTVAVWLWFTACVPPLCWIASHLHHHTNSDTEEDPHSPHIKGFWRVVFLTWYYVPSYARSNWTYAEKRYLKAYTKERLVYFLDRPFVSKFNFHIQFFLSTALGPVFIAFWLPRLILYMVLSGFVNAVGHRYGKRNCNNLATDACTAFQKLFGYMIGGETLGHNYHHCFPKSSSFRPGAFDPGFWFATKILRGKPANVRG